MTVEGAGAGSSAPAFDLPAELAIDTRVARRIIVDFIRSQLRQAGFERVLLGLSGGIDSALVAYLCAEAVGPERLLTVLMPYRTSSPDSRGDAEDVAARLRCANALVDISPIVDGYFGGADVPPDAASTEPADESAQGAGKRVSQLRRGNFMARARMAVLYDHSVTWGGLVAGTGNKTETLIGYTTLWGDMACAFNPLGDLYKSQVRQMARDIGVPEAIVGKAPSADLWPGQTDETEMGLSYAVIDRILFSLVDRRRTPAETIALGFDEAAVHRLDRMVASAEFKRQMPPIAKLGPRTAGIDYLYPRRRPGSARR